MTKGTDPAALRQAPQPEVLERQRTRWIEERTVIEGLVNTRVGLLLVFVGLAATVLADHDIDLSVRAAVCWVVAMTTGMVTLTVLRAHLKLLFALRWISCYAPDDPVSASYDRAPPDLPPGTVVRPPVAWIERAVRPLVRISMSSVIGIWVPLMLTVVLLIASIGLTFCALQGLETQR